MNLPIQPNSGDGQATPDPSENTDVKQTNHNQDASVTLDNDDSEKDVKLKKAITEAIANDKKAKEAKSKLTYLETFKTVAKDPNQIVQIHDTDPQLAEKLANDIYGKEYKQLFEQEKTMDATDIEKIVEKVMQKNESKSGVKKINTAVEDFFVENKILPGTDLFRKINDEFHGYTVKSVTQAKNVLSGLLRNFKPEDTSIVEDNSPSMSQNINSTGKKRNKNLSKGAEDLIKGFGYTDDQIKKAFVK